MNKPHKSRTQQHTIGMEKRSRSMSKSHLVLLFLFCLPLSATYAEDIIVVGKGAGRWSAGSLNNSVNVTNTDYSPSTTNGIASITNTPNACMAASSLQTIDGELAYRIAQGIWLIPEASVNATFVRNDIDLTSLTGTIGSPETQGTTYFDGASHNAVIPSGKGWCLALPYEVAPLRLSGAQSARITGEWKIITDGTQISGDYNLPEMYLATFTLSDHNSISILPSSRVVRVNTLECTVSTQDLIDFGKAQRNVTLHAELAKRSYTLTVNCGQNAGTSGSLVRTNVNVTFQQTTGFHDSNTAWLATNPTGAYITGEIDGSVTGSGECGINTGIPFDSTPLNMGTINSTETSKVLSQQITWRLCSGGTGLPSGKVQASADLSLTYN